MDHLNRSRELKELKLQSVDNLDPNSHLAIHYQSLTTATDTLWQLGLIKQQFINQGSLDNQANQVVNARPYTTDDLTRRLNRCANQWNELKRSLNEQA